MPNNYKILIGLLVLFLIAAPGISILLIYNKLETQNKALEQKISNLEEELKSIRRDIAPKEYKELYEQLYK